MQSSSADLSAAPKRGRNHRNIVIIDDDARDLQYMASMADAWRDPSVNVDCFTTVKEALAHLLDSKPDLVLLDDQLGAGERAEGSLERMQRAGFAGAVAIISGYTTPGRREGPVRAGAFSFVSKGSFDSAGLKLLLDMAAARDRVFRPKALCA